MNVITSSRKRKPAIPLNHELQSTYSSPLSRFTASRSSRDEFDTTIVVEQSVACSETPHIDASESSGFAQRNPPTQVNGVLEEPKKIFVVKVRKSLPWYPIFKSLICTRRTQTLSSPALNASPTLLHRWIKGPTTFSKKHRMLRPLAPIDRTLIP